MPAAARRAPSGTVAAAWAARLRRRTQAEPRATSTKRPPPRCRPPAGRASCPGHRSGRPRASASPPAPSSPPETAPSTVGGAACAGKCRLDRSPCGRPPPCGAARARPCLDRVARSPPGRRRGVPPRQRHPQGARMMAPATEHCGIFTAFRERGSCRTAAALCREPLAIQLVMTAGRLGPMGVVSLGRSHLCRMAIGLDWAPRSRPVPPIARGAARRNVCATRSLTPG